MPDIFITSHLQPPGDLPGFPLSDNATALEVMTLMDALALKIHPKGYWQLSWITSSSNVIIFIFIALAMRIYRSQKSPVALWLFKLEQRPYKVNWLKTQLCRLVRLRPAAQFTAMEKSTTTTTAVDAPDPDPDAEENATRMGSFITASCVNCHLVLTSTYVLLLFVRVIEGFKTREASASPPLIEPFMLDVAMQATIFSTAYFAALGYIAILLPDIPPWIWNNTVVWAYVATMTCGLVSLISIAANASKVNYYRTLVYNDLYFLPSLLDSTSTEHGGADRVVSAAVLQMARVAYKEALDQRSWLLCAHGLVSLGGILLALGYLLIFVTLTKKVAGELVQLRNDPPPDSGDVPSAPVNQHAVTTWPTASVPFSIPASQPNSQVFTTFLAQPNRLSRISGRMPPPTPAPNGPLPLPPASPTSRSSFSESVKDGDCEIIADASPRMLRTNASMSSIRKDGIAFERRGSLTSQQTKKMLEDSDQSHDHGVPQIRRESDQSMVDGDNSSNPQLSHHSFREEEVAELEFGPRTRLDSGPMPWAIDTLHDDLASNEGYVAVCRFLFNCIIDHVAVTLQCFAFGASSFYLCFIYSNEYPYDAQKASMQVARVNMVFSCSFSLLYLVNSLNLFAPFLLFPASQVKLATMLASLTSQDARLYLPGSGELGGFARRRLGSKKGKNPPKPDLHNAVDSPTLGRKASAVELLGTKVTSESYSAPSTSQEVAFPLASRTHPYAYPPNTTEAEVASSSLAHTQRNQWNETTNATDKDGKSTNRVSSTKLFPPRPSTAPSTQVGEPTSSLGILTSITKFSPFHRPHPPQVLPKPSSDSASLSYLSSQPTPNKPLKGRQLVLDSLISSHALPIQGFYCHRKTSSPLTIQQLNEMVELGLLEDAARSRSQSEFGMQKEEEKEEIKEGEGEGSTNRRLRMRQTFLSQVDKQRPIQAEQGGGISIRVPQNLLTNQTRVEEDEN